MSLFRLVVRRVLKARWAPIMGLILAAGFGPETGRAQEYGVFMRIADAPQGSMSAVVQGVETAAEQAGWEILASYQAGIDREQCSFTAQVLVMQWPEYVQVALSQGPHGAFAAALRVAVYEDEAGVHVSAVNPQSINRTIVAEEGMEQEWTRFAAILRRRLAEGAGATPTAGDYGQFREKGRIGKTMGVMAGGPFREKVKELESVPAPEGGAQGLARRVFEFLADGAPGEEWGIRPVYVMTPAPGIAVVGLTGERMEARSFSIVGNGSDKARSKFACPGIDHAAAYPIELVFTQEGDAVRISTIDAMFRMKMYFEDAGKLSFARNMGMPGSIEDEIRELIRVALF